MKYFIRFARGLMLFIGASLFFCGMAKADAFLNVPHFQQQTPVWCWVAAAQQIIAYKRGVAATPPQCSMVEAVDGASPGMCCGVGHPGCVHTGSFVQVANLIAYFGGSFSSYVLPANPYVIENTLNSGRPILAQIVTGSASTHVVVIRGIQMGPNPLLLINDPMAPAPYQIPFSHLASLWIDGIVVN